MGHKAVQGIVSYDVATGTTTLEARELEFIDEATLGRVVEDKVVGVYPSYAFQTFEGFGCAMTETSCYLLSQMEPEARREALKLWFGACGMDARFVRIHMDSCDYALSEYQAVEDPLADPELETFSIERDRRYILPVMREVLELTGEKLGVLLSPWSPPKQWKTPPELSKNDAAVYGGFAGDVDFSVPGRNFGGRLKPEFYGSWARYLVKYVQAYLDEGIPVTMLTTQNETSAATNWDSCLWSASQMKDFLKNHLYPQMKEAGLLDRVGIYVWDHNKERLLEHLDGVLDDETLGMIEGFAYHWYSGDHFDALQLAAVRYPGKLLMHTESCGLHIPGKPLAFELPADMEDALPAEMREQAAASPNQMDYADAEHYAHDLIGDLGHGMNRWIDWNMLVDRAGGPRHVFGGFAAPLVVEDDGSVAQTPSYAYLREISRTVRPGCVRVGSSCYDSDLDVVAVRNPDGGVGIVLQNRSEAARQVSLRMSGQIATLDLPAKTLVTVQVALPTA